MKSWMIRSAVIAGIGCMLAACNFAHAQLAPPDPGACASPIVVMFGEIDEKLAHKVAGQLLDADSNICKEPTTLYIDSPGGDIVAGGMIVDAILLSHRPVDTVNTAEAASMAAIIFETATGKRIAWPHSTLMLHRARLTLHGSPEQAQSQLAIWSRLLDRYETSIAAKLGMTLDQYRRAADAEIRLLPDEAVKAHLADEVATRK